MDYKAYAGIGSRRAPDDILRTMTATARALASAGWTLRSGHAPGSDRAFEDGAGANKEIFRPRDVTPEALALAEKFHPAWHACDQYARSLHARNGFQVLGRDLITPSKFICCWTIDGKATGGTGQALRIAAAYSIPIFNLFDPSALDRMLHALKENPK